MRDPPGVTERSEPQLRRGLRSSDGSRSDHRLAVQLAVRYRFDRDLSGAVNTLANNCSQPFQSGTRTADTARERGLLPREHIGVRRNGGGRDRVSPGADLEQFDDDSLFGLGRCGARATAPGCPASQVGRGRAAVVAEARIGTGAQQSLDSTRTSVPDSSMQWCHTAGGGCVGISARLDEIGNDLSLACRVPACRAGDADHRRVQRFGAPPVSGPNSGAAGDQVSCHLGVVTEPRSMQRSVALVDMGETLGKEELVAARQPGRRQRRCRAEKVHSGLMVKVRDRYQQPREARSASHGDCYLRCDR